MDRAADKLALSGAAMRMHIHCGAAALRGPRARAVLALKAMTVTAPTPPCHGLQAFQPCLPLGLEITRTCTLFT